VLGIAHVLLRAFFKPPGDDNNAPVPGAWTYIVNFTNCKLELGQNPPVKSLSLEKQFYYKLNKLPYTL
jgi:hypothetical protein